MPRARPSTLSSVAGSRSPSGGERLITGSDNLGLCVSYTQTGHYRRGVANAPRREIVAMPAIDRAKLTHDERLELLEERWDSQSGESDPFPLMEEQEVELDRRLDALDPEGAGGLSPEALRQRIRNRSS
jgi:putative addiction module component (TIGR02574 family)